MRSLLLSSAALLMVACSSTTTDLTPEPVLPEPTAKTKPPTAPTAPRPPKALGSLDVRDAPGGRMQTREEVYPDLVHIEAFPAQTPVSTDELVVVAVPPDTEDATRLGWIGAFLASGYRVKDAGLFGHANFTIDRTPWWHRVGDGFLRKVSLGEVPIPEDAEPEERTYSGFDGMNISLTDPTSLWAPDLLANPNLTSNYFLRLFSMKFDEVLVPIERRQVFDEAAVAEFRERVDEVNALIDRYNRDVKAYESSVRNYKDRWDNYRRDFNAWKESEEANYAREYDAYVASFNAWLAQNQRAIDARRSEGLPTPSRPDRAVRPAVKEKLKSRETTPVVELAESIDTTELEKAMGTVISEEVASRRVHLMFEVIDSTTGEVAQAVDATAVLPLPRNNAALLRAVVARWSR